MSEILKPCPFCGKNYAENAWDEYGSEYWECEFCGAASGKERDEYDWNTRPIEDALSKRIAELEDQLEDWTNNGWAEDYKARIAELEARLESCESALTSMVYQFFCPLKSGALAHSFMSAEEDAADYLVEFGLAQWADERKHAIVFLDRTNTN